MLTVAEIADKLKVHNNTIYKWIRQGMPHIKRGSVLRFELDKVEEWLREGK
jgi:excisionase family DNA binding protein